MQLHEVVPWGRSLDEYRRLFALSETDLRGRLLGCGDGPASFNAELTASGKSQRLVSVDPLYLFSGPEIATRSGNLSAEIVEVPYVFQKGGGRMLRVMRRSQGPAKKLLRNQRKLTIRKDHKEHKD